MNWGPGSDSLDLGLSELVGRTGLVPDGLQMVSRTNISSSHRRRYRPINHPNSIVAGLYRDGTLVIAGPSVPPTTAQSRSLATVLTPALAGHPWPDTVASNRFGGGRDRFLLTKVNPTRVAEVTADSAWKLGCGTELSV